MRDLGIPSVSPDTSTGERVDDVRERRGAFFLGDGRAVRRVQQNVWQAVLVGLDLSPALVRRSRDGEAFDQLVVNVLLDAGRPFLHEPIDDYLPLPFEAEVLHD